jgi:hypothetical protein
MAAAKAPKQSAPRRRWPAAEMRRIVELTLRAGASIGAIARTEDPDLYRLPEYPLAVPVRLSPALSRARALKDAPRCGPCKTICTGAITLRA